MLSGGGLGLLEPPVSRPRDALVPPTSHPRGSIPRREGLLLITRRHKRAQNRQARFLCPPSCLLTGSTGRVKGEMCGCELAVEDSPFDHESLEQCSAVAGRTLSPFGSPRFPSVPLGSGHLKANKGTRPGHFTSDEAGCLPVTKGGQCGSPSCLVLVRFTSVQASSGRARAEGLDGSLPTTHDDSQ